MKKDNYLLYDVNETPPIGKMIIFALQHVLAMFGATILVPILVNNLAGKEVLTIPVALFTSGLGTIIYLICTKGKSPVYLGSSFAFISPIAYAYLASGASAVGMGIFITGLVYILFAILIKVFGKGWIDKLLPPVVIGPMIMIIGLGLAPSAVSQIGLASETIEIKGVIVAVVSFLTTAIIATRAKGIIKVIPFLIGILVGYLLSICLGLVDFKELGSATFFSVPKFIIPFKDYAFSLSGVLTIVPIALVSIAEHIGDHLALGSIIKKDLIKDPGLERTLLGDGLATSVAGLLGGPANTTYGENTSVVGITKVASTKVILLAACISIIISFFGKITGILATIPNPVLGGVSLLLYGFITVNGLKVIVQNKIDFDNLKNVIVTSAMLVIGLGGAVISITTKNINLSISGMSLAAVVGIILNLILPNSR
ncbi:MAG: uracil-xanthine permease [Bacilli bacterium]|nr:uracil-xanthine permease [Bacilli bacterium]